MNSKMKSTYHTDVNTLYAFLIEMPPGAFITYSQFYAATGIKVNSPSGRQRLQRAAKRANIILLNQRGIGYEIDSPVNGVRIMEERFSRVTGAISRVEKSHSTIINKHLSEMSNDDQRVMVHTGVLLGAMRATADMFKVEEKPKISNSNLTITVPNLSNLFD